jgi:hypothetical protein
MQRRKNSIVVGKKLSEFGLNFKDTVALTHDDAAVMQKYGRLILAESQLCFNHGIYLSMTDVFYVKKRKYTKAQRQVKTKKLIMAPIIVMRATRVTKLLMATMMTTARFRKMKTQVMKL